MVALCSHAAAAGRSNPGYILWQRIGHDGTVGLGGEQMLLEPQTITEANGATQHVLQHDLGR